MLLSSLPTKPKQWAKKAGSSQIELGKGLRALPHRPASKITEREYILLRAFWPYPVAPDLDLTDFIQPELEKKAIALLENDKFFQQYLAALGQRVILQQVSYNGRSGVFDLVLYQQDQIQRIDENKTSDATLKLDMSPRRPRTRSLTRQMNDQIQANQQSPSQPKRPRVRDTQPELLPTIDPSQENRSDDPGGTGKLREAPFSSEPSGSPTSEGGCDSAQSDTTSSYSSSNPVLAQAASDEQIVNAGLMSFLAALTMYHSPNAIWTMERKSFRMRDLYEARTDGYLHHRSSKDPLAILETKAHMRKAKLDETMMQETAQMAAWIGSQPDSGFFTNVTDETKKHRLLVSQDHNEIYLTIATYDNEYERYLRETSKPSYISADELQELSDSPRSDIPEDETSNEGRTTYQFHTDHRGPFLQMNCYGPWHVRKTTHMQDFAQKILALTCLSIKDTHTR